MRETEPPYRIRFKTEKWVSNHRALSTNGGFDCKEAIFFPLHVRRLRKETNPSGNCEYCGGVSLSRVFDRYKKKTPPVTAGQIKN